MLNSCCCCGAPAVVGEIGRQQQHSQPKPAQQNKCTKDRQRASQQLQAAVSALLAAAGLQPQPQGHWQPATSVACLVQQVEAGAARAGPRVRADISRAAERLLKLHRQHGDPPHTAEPSAADTLVNLLTGSWHRQVVLDSHAVLCQRRTELLALVAAAGFRSCSSLAASVLPPNKAVIADVLMGGSTAEGDAKVSCIVSRAAAFWDALPQLQQQGIVPLCSNAQQTGSARPAKLFPRFVEEAVVTQQQHQQQPQFVSGAGSAAALEAGEGHGVRKEFFSLVATNWTTAAHGRPALLVHLRAAGTWWLNGALQCSHGHLQQAYWSAGWLLGQALHNRCTLGLPLAPLLFQHLLLPEGQELQPGMEQLEQHDPDAASSVRAVLRLPGEQYKQLLQLEGLPSTMRRQEYVRHAVQQLLVGDVRWQVQALRQGFQAAVDPTVLADCCFASSSLAGAVCGPCTAADADFRVHEAFTVRLEDEDGTNEGGGNDAGSGSGSSSSLVLQCLWAVLDGWGVGQKRTFVKFVTGIDRPPWQPGCEQLVISFPFVALGQREQRLLLGTLPQSHTCSNTLELPDYAEALVATDRELAAEWEARGTRMQHGRQRRPSGIGKQHQLAAACPMLWQRCCSVLEDRLLAAITHCVSYGLDTS